MKISRALLSVSDKTGLVDFARSLSEQGVELLSTGGTSKLLRAEGIPVKDVSDFTGFPEMMDGRVKTLHPKVHGGLLYLREDATHVAQATEHGILPIDLVVVNLYPFEQTLKKPGVAHHDLIENIDIGGPAMLRSAAKNHNYVTVLCDPADYAECSRQIRDLGNTTQTMREKLAAKVFAHTSYYDSLIADYLRSRTGLSFGCTSSADKPETETPTAVTFPETLTLSWRKAQSLRYGENPHQAAALFGPFHDYFKQLHGKELSYNNILDLTAAAQLIADFEVPTLAILKHTNPCGVATDENQLAAWELAYATDKQAPFGGIITVNRPLDAATATAISEIFSEVILAPEFSADALAILQRKKNLRLLTFDPASIATCALDIRSVPHGLLVQQRDSSPLSGAGSHWKTVTQRAPSPEELAALDFAWRVVKHVKSNAIVYGGKSSTLGIGAGQMSRVDSSKLAVWKAGEAGLSLKGSVVASDAFFPFADGAIAAAEAGATAIIQPGGSVRDEEVIAACNERNVAMIFTGQRHFRH